jgi:hypothetical protein
MMPRFYDVSVKPGLSRLSQSSMKMLSSASRTRTTQSESAVFKESASSTIKPLSKVVVGSSHSDSDFGHGEYIELPDPSVRSAMYQDTARLVDKSNKEGSYQ